MNFLNFYNKIKGRYVANRTLGRNRVFLFHRKSFSPYKPRLPLLKLNISLKLLQLLQSPSSRVLRSMFRLRPLTLQSFLNTNESLYRLTGALWRVYQSNNLQLRHSFVNLIRAVVEQNYRLREMAHETNIFYRTLHTSQTKQSEVFNRVNKISQVLRTKNETVLQKSELVNFAQVVSKVRLVRSLMNTRLKNTIHENTSILPTLERIYETIESNYLFYNNSSYQSTRTLYRLTNSLWKVYSSQNLELSKNFTRLITTITERNSVVQLSRNPHNMFNTTQSLYSLVNALRQAFSGNNLQLRKSLVNLVSDITSVGHKSNYNNNLYNSRYFDNRIKYSKRNQLFLLVHRRFAKTPNASDERIFDEKAAHALIDKKLSPLKAELLAQNQSLTSPESLISSITQRIKDEQAQQWRLEKLQRGLF